MEAGSWDLRGATADVSTPLTADASVRTRVVGRFTESDSFIDLESNENGVFYAVMEADLGEKTVLTFGGSSEKNQYDGARYPISSPMAAAPIGTTQKPPPPTGTNGPPKTPRCSQSWTRHWTTVGHWVRSAPPSLCLPRARTISPWKMKPQSPMIWA